MELIRGVSPTILDALKRPFYPILMAYVDWPDSTVYTHTGVGDIYWDGGMWRGVAAFASVSLPSDTVGGVAASDAVLSLVGVPADLDGKVNDPIRNRSVQVYVALVKGRPGGHDGAQKTGDGNTLVGPPVPLFSGAIDSLDLDAVQTQKGVDHEARLGVSTGPSARSSATAYHSDEDQRKKYPWDTAGRHLIMARARAEKLTWPQN